MPTPVIIRLPTMALSKPPLEPGGGVDFKNMSAFRADTPFMTRLPRIKNNQTKAMPVMIKAMPTKMALMKWRRETILLFICCVRLP